MILAKAFYNGGRPGYSITSPYTGVRYIFVGKGIPAKIENEKDVEWLSTASPDIVVIKDEGSVHSKKPIKKVK